MNLLLFNYFGTLLLLILPRLAPAWSASPLPRVNAMVAASLILTAPLSVDASVDFTGDYSDPKHPNCQRQVNVLGQKAYVSGTDGNPGCPTDGSGNPWKLVGTGGEEHIFVDFSPLRKFIASE